MHVQPLGLRTNRARNSAKRHCKYRPRRLMPLTCKSMPIAKTKREVQATVAEQAVRAANRNYLEFINGQILASRVFYIDYCS